MKRDLKSILAEFSGPVTCQASMGQEWYCELRDDGHEWHERWSDPVAARWRDMPFGGRQFSFMGTGSSPAVVG
jgi:hypothetical protein